ncbi:hypothetical protein H7683_00615 [Ectopseudomonas mendocina]|uniref:hypothetical protein n=1 Tax=Ectopseudomonas mendocina TaxID=300 RepID=UPI001ADF4A01|nr:hypothetical protein [Pseudomonas mendocina]QTN46165.1 hypothetical protein H7683_00615 [Pseudomonas mendocina]
MTPIDTDPLFANIRFWLELTYYASGIIVMCLVALGLWQLKMAKDQISLAKNQLETSKEIFRTQSKRASVEAAVVECRRFSETVVLESLALDRYCKEHDITYFEDVVITKTKDGFKINIENVNEDDAKKLSGAEDIINRFMNGLEAHALFFLSGVADEKIAFHTNAKTFIEFAQIAFKVIPLCSLEDDDIKPIKTLYFIWDEKLEANKLKLKKKEIETQLSSYKEKEFSSIGAD